MPSGTPSGKGLYLTVYHLSRPNTDTVQCGSVNTRVQWGVLTLEYSAVVLTLEYSVLVVAPVVWALICGPGCHRFPPPPTPQITSPGSVTGLTLTWAGDQTGTAVM